MNFWSIKNLAAVWLCALFLNAFSTALFAKLPTNAAETVYCPLTKKLQPVKAAKKEVRQNPLEEICAADAEKKSFAAALFKQNLLKTSFLDENEFEYLVFDFFQKGKTAFADLPPFPDSPHQNTFKTSPVVAGFSQNDQTRFALKSTAEDFSFAQNARPPNLLAANLFESETFSKLETISRRSAPRAPPISL